MKKLFLGTIVPALAFTFIACSDDSSSSNEDLSYHYDTSLEYDKGVLALDSISNCIDGVDDVKLHDQVDSVFVESRGDDEVVTFPSRISTTRDVINSVGVYVAGDTLKVALIESEKTPNYTLDCPVWGYTTVKGEINSKYISTASGVYVLGRK